ncbi:hypothetical protein [Microbacterium sp.]|uniref:hypothetical protein n=1 Tax=Microbacterium sp. TaxID=51671 RepID=UPI003F9C45C1
MVTGAASDQTPGSDKQPSTGPTPPLANLSGRPEPVPGPLTKPSPVIRPQRRRARWLVPLIVVIVLVAAGAGAVIWQLSVQ